MNKENHTVQTEANGRKTMKAYNNDIEQFVNSRIVQLQKQLLDKDLELEKLQKQPSQPNTNRLKLLEIKHETLNTENQQLKNQLQQYENLNKTLQKKCDSYQVQMEQLTGIFEETQRQLEQERQQKYNTQFQQSSQHMDVQQEKLLIKTQIDNLRKEKNSLGQRVKELEGQLQFYEQNQNAHTQELSAMKQQLQQQIQKAQDYLEKTQILEVKNNLLENQSKNSCSQTEELKTLRGQVMLAQKEKNQYQETMKELESKLRVQTEHSSKLQNLLNEKTKQIVKYQDKLNQIESIEEDNSTLQSDLEKVTSSMEEIQLENQRIAKFQQQKIDQLKRELAQTDNIREEIKLKQEEILNLKYTIEKLRVEMEKFKESNNELNQLREGQKCWQTEKDNYQKKINYLADELDKMTKGQYDQLRVQVETQLQMKFSAEKVQMENHLWQLSQQVGDMQAQVEQYSNKISQLNVENDQLREQLNEKQITSKTVIVLEGQLRNQANEIEKLKAMLTQRTQELDILRNKTQQLEGCANYAQELEKKVQALMSDNQRLNSIIMDRCKNNW